MLETGIVMLLQANAAVAALSPYGGFSAELQPKDAPLPNWTYLNAGDVINDGMQFSTGMAQRRIQIDCYANTANDAIELGKAIDAVLNGYSGHLPDPDATLVHPCFRSDIQGPFFDEERRTYRRLLEYEINYYG